MISAFLYGVVAIYDRPMATNPTGQHTAIDLPERINRKVLAQLRFEGVSATMMPDGTVLYNEEADSALNASRREAAAEATASPNGLSSYAIKPWQAKSASSYLSVTLSPHNKNFTPQEKSQAIQIWTCCNSAVPRLTRRGKSGLLKADPGGSLPKEHKAPLHLTQRTFPNAPE